MIETKGKNGPLSLEEIAALFDGQENTVLSNAQGLIDQSNGPHAAPMELDEKKGIDYDHQEVSSTHELKA